MTLEKQVLPGEEGRCSSCGEEILETEAEIVLFEEEFPEAPLFFHEREECSEPALAVAEAYPEEWTAAMRIPGPWGSEAGPVPPRYGPELN